MCVISEATTHHSVFSPRLQSQFHPNLTEILLGPMHSAEREMVDLDLLIKAAEVKFSNFDFRLSLKNE